jgi:hypothetical protein
MDADGKRPIQWSHRSSDFHLWLKILLRVLCALLNRGLLVESLDTRRPSTSSGQESDAAKREFFKNTQIAQTRAKTILFFDLFCDFSFIHIKKMESAKTGSRRAHFLGLFRMFWEPKEAVCDSAYRRFWRVRALKTSRSLSGCSRVWLRPGWGG